LKLFLRIKNYIQKYGLITTLKKISNIFITFFASTRFAYLLDLNKATVIKDDARYHFKQADNISLDAMYKKFQKEISNKRLKFLNEIARNHNSECLLVLNKKDDICGYGCLILGKEKHFDIFKKIDGMQIGKNGYLCKDYIFKKHRKKGAQTALIAKRVNMLLDKSFRSATSIIAKGNLASDKAYKKFNFKKVLKVVHFHFFNFYPKSSYWIRYI
jgi:hypothetical protein